MTVQEAVTARLPSLRIPSRARLSAIVGSRSALSLPVIAGFLVTGFALSFKYQSLVTDEPWPSTALKAIATLILPCGLLLGVRVWAFRRDWARPRVLLVLVTLSCASVLRSPIGNSAMAEGSGVGAVEGNPLGRTVTSLLLTLAITLTIGAAVHLARERNEAQALLLAEQKRLRELVAATDEDLRRSAVELRVRAVELLEPSIAEIRQRLKGELSDVASREVSTHILRVVDEVVRPTSRHLADSPSFTLGSLDLERPAVWQWLTDRLDMTRAIRPVLVWVLGWGVLAPGLLIIGPEWWVIGWSWLAGAGVMLILYAVKWAWPERYRRMPVALGLVVLSLVYFVSVGSVQVIVHRGASHMAGHALWSATSWNGLVLWVGLAVLVSVLAMLDEHGRQHRASLAEINVRLEEVIARLRRESWLLHRSVALAVHGPVQSALIATSMRLSAGDRTTHSVNDARRRLDQALTVIEQDTHEVPSIDDALADLIGLWGPVVRIRADVTPNVESHLAGDPGLRRCVVEVCREAVSNAIRHGRAVVVDVSMVHQGEKILIRVSDDGHGLPSVPVAGLGSAMLDATCLRWSLTNGAEGGAELTAEVL